VFTAVVQCKNRVFTVYLYTRSSHKLYLKTFVPKLLFGQPKRGLPNIRAFYLLVIF
jgi:hypothetical protein